MNKNNKDRKLSVRIMAYLMSFAMVTGTWLPAGNVYAREVSDQRYGTESTILDQTGTEAVLSEEVLSATSDSNSDIRSLKETDFQTDTEEVLSEEVLPAESDSNNDIVLHEEPGDQPLTYETSADETSADTVTPDGDGEDPLTTYKTFEWNDPYWNSFQGKVIYQSKRSKARSFVDVAKLQNYVITSTGSVNDAVYYVEGRQTLDERVTIKGNKKDVYLILTPGCSLSLKKGLQVQDFCFLYIVNQAADGDPGHIYAYGDDNHAGIGVDDWGELYICGGYIGATGGENAAGIGSNYGEKSGYIYIYGNDDLLHPTTYVSATGGKNGAGIGGGWTDKSYVTWIEIYGGMVDAVGGGTGAAGIGGGNCDVETQNAQGLLNILVHGGRIDAIGKAPTSDTSDGGAGIGIGHGSRQDSRIIIDPGIMIGGKNGDLDLLITGEIEYVMKSGKTEPQRYDQYALDHRRIILSDCTDHEYSFYRFENGHIEACANCGKIKRSYEQHTYVKHTCSVCGYDEPKHSVTFNLDNGESPVVKKYYIGDTIVPPSPVREGSTFGGWYPGLPQTMPDSDLETEAVWYVIHYNIPMYIDGEVISTQRVEYDRQLTPIETDKNGCDFDGWYTTPDYSGAKYDFSKRIKSEFSLYGRYIPRTYTITFDTDGGSTIPAAQFTYGSVVSEPEPPVKEGVAFAGWDPAIPVTMPAGNLTVKAIWGDMPRCKVSFYVDGTKQLEREAVQGKTVSRPGEATEEGYDFDGWYTDTNCTVKYDFATPVNADLNLYGKLIKNQYTITFDTDGGSQISPITLNYGDKITPPKDPKKIGYAFKGWNPSIPDTMPAMDFTAKAIWGEAFYTVSFIVDGETISTSAVSEGTKCEYCEYSTDTGLYVNGWYTDADFKSRFDFDTPVTSDLTLYGKLEKAKFTVTFDTAGGTKVPALTLEYGDPIVVPDEPVKTGFTFEGWEPSLPETMPAKNLNVKARWSEQHCIVTFDYLGSKDVPDGVETVDVIYGSMITEPDHVEFDGLRFVGWMIPGQDLPFDFDNTPVTSDITLRVLYEWYESYDPFVVEFAYAGTAIPAYNDISYNSDKKRYEQVYTGSAITPEVRVTGEEGEPLINGVDYTVKYSNNVKADLNTPAKAIITGKGKFKGTKELPFTIVPVDLEDALRMEYIQMNSRTIEGEPSITAVYGSKITPDITILKYGYRLSSKDYTLDNNGNVITDTKVSISGKGNFNGSIRDLNVKVISKEESVNQQLKVTLKADKHYVDPFGSARTNMLTITNGSTKGELTVTNKQGEILTENVHFSVKYGGHLTQVGTVRVTITGIGEYSASKSVVKTYKILPNKTVEIRTVELEGSEYSYAPQGVSPEFRVEAVGYGDKGEENTLTLAKGIDYRVSFSGHKKVGAAKCTISFIGDFKGHKPITAKFSVVPAKFNVTCGAYTPDMLYSNPGKYESAPFVTNMWNDLLKKGRDYDVAYFDEKGNPLDRITSEPDDKTITVVITGKGNYTEDMIKSEYHVRRYKNGMIDLKNAKIVAGESGTSDKSAGKGVVPAEYSFYGYYPDIDLRIKVNGKWTTVSPDSYEVRVGSYRNLGMGTVWIESKDENLVGKCSTNYKIISKSLSGFSTK